MKDFTAVIQALLQIDRDEDAMHDEVDAMYAPSECHGDVGRGADDRRMAVMEKFGVTHDEMVAEAKRRGIDCRWMHVHGPIIPDPDFMIENLIGHLEEDYDEEDPQYVGGAA